MWNNRRRYCKEINCIHLLPNGKCSLKLLPEECYFRHKSLFGEKSDKK